MAPTTQHDIGDAGADPFHERSAPPLTVRKDILGGHFHFESASEALLRLVEAAYGGLPPQRRYAAPPMFHVELRLVPRQTDRSVDEPPPVRTQSGAGLLCGVMDASNYVLVSPGQRRALVVVSEDMLSHPYHVRYELIEFAVFLLAARGMDLVPLHGACVGREGRGILLLGASGAGKSTLALHSLLQGMDFLAEDAVFVQPDNMLATGVANYLHVRDDALRFVDDKETRRWIGESPVIRRRSGVEKFEADLRLGRGRSVATPMTLIGAVLVSNRIADDPDALLSPIPRHEIAGRLSADQPYAAAQPGWRRFEQEMMRMGMHRLLRGRHPRDSADALLTLLSPRRVASA
ncbi:hypothetical protein EC912_101820 [Luteibacter rhizovicinus]|uniref:Hpr(Ser) kinase/phosphatase n=1 Tax=Luteibacter rhizovicinus TaxID=242606 RepID=A0A4R3Z1X3_9GAMM|nr:serine kinase [Luteibacter rhizovicinus]TCV97803.1 hypothetical protein EC912_101820 [Luteibacter rhizovicinus]